MSCSKSFWKILVFSIEKVETGSMLFYTAIKTPARAGVERWAAVCAAARAPRQKKAAVEHMRVYKNKP
jgi:hypothetical protein